MLKLKEKIDEYSLHVKQYMNPPLIRLIDNVFYQNMSDESWGDGMIASGKDKSIRSVKVREFPEESIKNSISKRIIYKDLKRFVSGLENLYKEHVSDWYFSKDNYFQFLHYDKSNGGHYDYHTDHFKENPRTLTILVGLNNPKEYEGGELLIGNQSEGLKLGMGDVICFPSNFLYPHKVMPLTKGERKVLVIWTQ